MTRAAARRAAPAWPRSWSIAISICRPFAPWSPARLPAYARPLFLRLLPALESTGTFKPRKQDLVARGIRPRAGIAIPLYFDDPRAGAYVPLDAALYAAIAAGRMRLVSAFRALVTPYCPHPP